MIRHRYAEHRTNIITIDNMANTVDGRVNEGLLLKETKRSRLSFYFRYNDDHHTNAYEAVLLNIM